MAITAFRFVTSFSPSHLLKTWLRSGSAFSRHAERGKLYVGARLACNSCHINDGTTPYAAPMTGIAPLFPEFSQRAKRIISLRERIDECFIRSENGRPLPEDAKEMTALVAYIESLSGQNDGGAEPSAVASETSSPGGSPQRGEAIFAAQCAVCPRLRGNGVGSTFPPLWGQESFNDGAWHVRDRKHGRFCGQEYAADESGVVDAAAGVRRIFLYPHQSRAPNTIPHSTNTNSTPRRFCEKIGLLRSKCGVGFPVSGVG